MRNGLTLLLVFCITFLSAQTVQTFTTSGSFTVPAGVTNITVEAWGGGGAGGSAVGTGAPTSYRAMGGAGGGGAYVTGVITVVPNDVISYTVAASTGLNAGTTALDGGSSIFSTITAPGGSGGICVNAGTNGGHIGGAGGAGGTGTTNGGAGGSSVGYAGTTTGTTAGGGGGAGTMANGGNGGAWSSTGGQTNGGTGGSAGGGAGANGRGTSGQNGLPGVLAGGGGSGAFAAASTSFRSGGSGAAGQIRISYVVPMPVALTNFDGNLANDKTNLSFATASESNNSHFEIERSADGRNFTKIGEVKGAGTTSDEQNYSFVDENPLKGLNYYRLKQVDFDGAAEYSKVVSVRFGTTRSLSVIPTMVYDQINVDLSEMDEQTGEWQIFDLNGRQVMAGSLESGQSNFVADMSALTEGTYLVRVQIGDELLTEKVQKL
jgi:hypothetical protein